MKMRLLSKGVSGIGLAVGLSLAMASTAYSAPVFEVTPSALGGPSTPFNSDFIQGNAASLLTLDPTTNTVHGVGHIVFTGFANPSGGVVNPPVSGLGTDYQLWSTYEYDTKLVSGTFGQAGSTYDITSLTYSLLGATGTGTTFTDADAATGTAPTVTPGGPVEQIGSGTLLNGVGGAGFNAQGGSFFNSQNTYQNTAFGNSFFTAPVPFFDLSFDEFNNTTQGIDRSGNFIAISSASGGIDFNKTSSVPEPGSLALLSLGLLGLGLSRKRRSVKSV